MDNILVAWAHYAQNLVLDNMNSPDDVKLIVTWKYKSLFLIFKLDGLQLQSISLSC